MVIDLDEDPGKSTGPARLTEEVMGIMCRWDWLENLKRVDGRGNLDSIAVSVFGLGNPTRWVAACCYFWTWPKPFEWERQDGKLLLKLGKQGLWFLCGREVGRLLVDNSFWSHKRVKKSQTLNSGFPEKSLWSRCVCIQHNSHNGNRDWITAFVQE